MFNLVVALLCLWLGIYWSINDSPVVAGIEFFLSGVNFGVMLMLMAE